MGEWLHKRPILAVAAAVVAVGIGLAAVRAETSGSDIAGSPSSDHTRTGPVPVGATALSRGPLVARFGQSTVWTGDELIVWGGAGGEGSDRRFNDGAAYNPSTDRWRTIADVPLSRRRHHVAEWTGTEMIVVGGDDGELDGAAYDPARDSWRLLPTAPFVDQSHEPGGIAGAWTGSVLALWRFRTDELALYDPNSDRWRPAPGPGERFTSGRLLAGSDRLYAVGSTDDVLAPKLSSFDAGTNTWRAAPGPPIPGGPVGAAVLGDRLFLWQQGPGTAGKAMGGVFSPTSGGWEPLPPAPLHGCDAPGNAVQVTSSSVLVFNLCGPALLLHGSRREWMETSLESTSGENAVSTGIEVLSWGDACCFGSANPTLSVTPWRWRLPQ